MSATAVLATGCIKRFCDPQCYQQLSSSYGARCHFQWREPLASLRSAAIDNDDFPYTRCYPTIHGHRGGHPLLSLGFWGRICE